jgi:hypothetical protein
MDKIDANQTAPAYELKDELARLCLPSATRYLGEEVMFLSNGLLLPERSELVAEKMEIIPYKSRFKLAA